GVPRSGTALVASSSPASVRTPHHRETVAQTTRRPSCSAPLRDEGPHRAGLRGCNRRLPVKRPQRRRGGSALPVDRGHRVLGRLVGVERLAHLGEVLPRARRQRTGAAGLPEVVSSAFPPCTSPAARRASEGSPPRSRAWRATAAIRG